MGLVSQSCHLTRLPGDRGGWKGPPCAWFGGGIKLFGESGGFQSTREMILQCSLALVQPAALALGFFDIACSRGV